MKTCEDSLYVKSKTQRHKDRYWVFDLATINTLHHGFETDKDGKPVPFVDLPDAQSVARFYDTEFVFAIYRKNTNKFYVLTHRQVVQAIMAPNEVSDMLKRVTNTVDGDKWCPCPDGYDD